MVNILIQVVQTEIIFENFILSLDVADRIDRHDVAQTGSVGPVSLDDVCLPGRQVPRGQPLQVPVLLSIFLPLWRCYLKLECPASFFHFCLKLVITTLKEVVLAIS